MPARWELRSPKALFRERRTPNLPEDVHLTPSQKYGVLPQLEYIERTGGSVVLNLAGQDKMKHVETNDFIIHLRSFQGGLERARRAGKVSSAYTVIEPKPLAAPGYYGWMLKSSAFIQELQTTTNQLRDGQSIRWTDFIKVPLPTPPLHEQQSIAAYLDREAQRIDELIEEQRGLIETLRERQQAAIESSVFGLEEDVARTARTEPWLPGLPASWEAMQLGFVTESQAGYAFPSEGFKHGGLGTRLLRGINVKPDGVDWSDRVTWDEETEPISSEYVLETGDIVLGMDRPFVGAGIRVTVIRDEDLPALLVQRVLRVRAAEKMRDGYLGYILRTSALKHYLEPMFTGVSVPHISEWQVRKFVVPVPPVNEQREIADALDEQTSRINALISESEDLIALSLERRAALITAAVTGQIDVRTAV